MGSGAESSDPQIPPTPGACASRWGTRNVRDRDRAKETIMFVVLELPDGRPAVVRVGDELTFMGESDFPSIRVRAVCATRAEALAWVAANM